MKYGFVYIWYDRKRRMYYVGSHWGTEDDGYICSSNRMRDAYRRRPQDFKRRVLSRIYTTRKELLEEEQKWLDRVKRRDRYYNLNYNTLNLWWSDPNYKLTVGQKISKAGLGRKARPETKAKMSKAHKGKIIGDGQRQFLSVDKRKRTYVSNITLNKTMHVYNVDVEKWISAGWYIGRLPGWGRTHTLGKKWKRVNGNVAPNTGKRLYNNGLEMRLFLPDVVPEGWQLGKLNGQ